MNKLMVIALLVGLTGCHAGFGVGDNRQEPSYAASDAWQSAMAQASIGTFDAVVPVAY